MSWRKQRGRALLCEDIAFSPRRPEGLHATGIGAPVLGTLARGRRAGKLAEAQLGFFFRVSLKQVRLLCRYL